MKLFMWYALRDVRRRPKQFLSLVAVSAAALAVIILAVLWEEALWRESVMPEREYNYHFYFYNLRPEDKEYLNAQPWVLTTYDVYSDSEHSKNTVYENSFRVRVTWENNARAATLARDFLTESGLLEREPYATQYENAYKSNYANLTENWTPTPTLTVETMARNNTITSMLDEYILNNSYMRSVINGYAMQSGFLLRLFLLMLFLGGAILILTLESYRENFREYGTLRALGYRNRQLLTVNLCKNLLVNLTAIPTAAATTWGAVRLYYGIIAPYREQVDSVYFTVADFIPLPMLLFLALCLLAASLTGTVIVYAMHRSKSLMSYLRAEDAFAVSFVSKTSPRFESARRILAYCRLYAVRARGTLARFTAVTAVMMPLPMFYLVSGLNVLGEMDSDAGKVGAIYIAFQAIAVLITTLCVTHAASRMLAASRASELGVIRALGGSKSTIRQTTYPIAAMQFFAVLALSLWLSGTITGAFATNITVASRENAKTIAEIVSSGLLGVCTAVCFVLPSAFSGLIAFLIGFFRRPIIAAIRETE